MQKVNTKAVEMIRSREKNGFCFVYDYYHTERVARTPAIGKINRLRSKGFWRGRNVIEKFVLSTNGKQAGVKTKAKIVHDKHRLFVGILMEEPEMASTRALVTKKGTKSISKWKGPRGKFKDGPPIPYSMEKDDAVELFLDLTGNRKRFVKIFTNMAGVTHSSESECGFDQSVYPQLYFLEKWNGKFKSKIFKGRDHWIACFEIPWHSTGAVRDKGHQMGVNIRRTRTNNGFIEKQLLAFAPTEGVVSAFDAAVLRLNNEGIEIREIDLNRPVYGHNSAKLRIRNVNNKSVSLTIRSEIKEAFTKVNRIWDTKTIRLGPGEEKRIHMKYFLNWHLRGTVQKLSLVVNHKETKHEVLRFPFEFGEATGFSSVEETGIPPQVLLHHKIAAENPLPNDPNFIDKKRQYLLSKLPRFVRTNTTQGAVSDFTLRSLDGRYEFNLMKKGALRNIARMIEGKFPDRFDRLVAACILASDNIFTMHMREKTGLIESITPLSALRLNGGQCSSRSMSLYGIIQNMRTGKGKRVYGNKVCLVLVLGHVIVGVEAGRGGEFYYLDPTFGSFFYTRDNKRLATNKELEKDLWLADRIIINSTHNFCETRFHTFLRPGPIVYPSNAPAE